MHTNFKSYNLISENIKKIVRKKRNIPEEPIYVLGNVKNDFEYVTRSDDNADNKGVYEIPFENLKRIKNILGEKNISFIVVFFPHGHQVSAKEWAKGRQFYGLEKNKLYSLKSIKVLMELSKEDQIDAYDASGAFIDAEGSLFPLFYPFDGHFTANGNFVFANFLSSVIRDKMN